jgi:hypothetical protein
VSADILDSRITLPEHVVLRDFGDETVVLNLRTGLYHGLNPTAAAMLEAMRDSPRISEVVARLADDFGQPRERVSADLVTLVERLKERELVELHAGGG